jgi:lysophospholipase L1-like esterase
LLHVPALLCDSNETLLASIAARPIPGVRIDAAAANDHADIEAILVAASCPLVRYASAMSAEGKAAAQPIWMGLALSLTVAVLLLVSMEVVVRLTDADRRLFPGAFKDPYKATKLGWWKLMTYDPVVYWRGRPFARLPGTDEFLNDRGFRGSVFRDDKARGLKRVVCMGDSATFGLVSHEGAHFTFSPTYSSELQKLLNTNESRQTVEVINAGVIGYSTSEGLRQLKHEVRYWHPDLITIRYGMNDHLQMSSDFRPDFESHNSLVRWLQDGLLDLRIYQLIVRLKSVPQLVAARVPAKRAARSKKTPKPLTEAKDPRVPLPQFDYNMRRLVSEARSVGARVILMTAPVAPPFPEITTDTRLLNATGYPSYDEIVAQHRRYEDVVRTVARDMDVDLADGSSDLAARGLEQFFTHYDFAHPNGDGHVAIAHDLAALIRSKELLR